MHSKSVCPLNSAVARRCDTSEWIVVLLATRIYMPRSVLIFCYVGFATWIGSFAEDAICSVPVSNQDDKRQLSCAWLVVVSERTRIEYIIIICTAVVASCCPSREGRRFFFAGTGHRNACVCPLSQAKYLQMRAFCSTPLRWRRFRLQNCVKRDEIFL